MTELANLLPALAGILLGIVALVTSHVATRRLAAHQQVLLNEAAAQKEAEEPHLAGTFVQPGNFVNWYGGETIVGLPAKKSENAS